MGRNRVTLHKWMRQYKAGGIERLLTQKSSLGRPRTIPTWAEKALLKRLHQPQGFNSYQEIVEWLEQNLEVNTCYKAVHQLVIYAALYLEIGKLTKPIIASIAQRQYIMAALSVAGF